MTTLFQILLRDNWQAFEALNQRAGHQMLLDPLMVFGAQDLIYLAPLLLLALWFATARWSLLGRNRSAATSARERSWLEEDRQLGQRVALLGTVGVVFALALNILLGHLVLEPRPFISHPGLVHQLIAHATDNSFPSDHEAMISAVTTALGLNLLFILKATVQVGANTVRRVRLSLEVRRRFLPELTIAIGLFTVAVVALCWVGVARVYTGVHYPGDIVVGVLCGFVGSVFAVALRPVVEPLVTSFIGLAERVRLA
jgi:undecaprenyl-diphosphatase